MRFTWRERQPLETSDAWAEQIAPKDNVLGRSAPSLALSWAGPVAMAGALATHAATSEFRLEAGSVEAQTSFDEHPGGPRNHDLLLVGEASGGRTVVSIESKVDESFGETLRDYLSDADRKADRGESTNARARAEGLLAAIAGPRGTEDERLLALRFQLFSGVAGAVAAAADNHAEQAVFLVHEFVTDGVNEQRRLRNAEDLRAFGATVFDLELPLATGAPWCVGPLPFVGSARLQPSAQLFIAKTVTSLSGLSG